MRIAMQTRPGMRVGIAGAASGPDRSPRRRALGRAARHALLAGALALTSACTEETGRIAQPPEAKAEPRTVRMTHGATREDPYAWMQDPERRPEVDRYTLVESVYARNTLAPLRELRTALENETRRLLPDSVESDPVRNGDVWYAFRRPATHDRGIIVRAKAGSDGGMGPHEEVVLDLDAEAGGSASYRIAAWSVSPDGRTLAYAEDRTGERIHTLRFKDLTTGQHLADRIEGTWEHMLWADDSRTLFHVDKKIVDGSHARVRAYVVGSGEAATLVHEEPDLDFEISLMRTADGRYLCIVLDAGQSTEMRCAPARAPTRFVPLAEREPGVRYVADHVDGRWIIRTNAPQDDGRPAPNGRLMTAPGDTRSRADWRTLLPHRDDTALVALTAAPTHGALLERADGLARIRLLPAWDAQAMAAAPRHIRFDEPAYAVELVSAGTDGGRTVRYRYSSMTTPYTLYEYDLDTGERRRLKRTQFPGYAPERYVTERVWVTARDGARIPVSLVRRREVRVDGTAPLYLTAYGSDGLSLEAAFSPTVIAMLDRGVVYAIVHVRGGGEFGQAWHDGGRLRNKRNGITDFLDATDALVERGYGAPGRVAAHAGSAGGLIVGAIANMAPGKYRALVAEAPVLDPVALLSDPREGRHFDEWGDPSVREDYDVMMTYSPYQNLTAQPYPAMLIWHAALDSQVPYWQAPKYLARLRDLNTSDRPLLLYSVDTGHGGLSGRDATIQTRALLQAFVLWQLDATQRI